MNSYPPRRGQKPSAPSLDLVSPEILAFMRNKHPQVYEKQLEKVQFVKSPPPLQISKNPKVPKTRHPQIAEPQKNPNIPTTPAKPICRQPQSPEISKEVTPKKEPQVQKILGSSPSPKTPKKPIPLHEQQQALLIQWATGQLADPEVRQKVAEIVKEIQDAADL